MEHDVAWTVQVDPLTFAIGIAHVQVERALGERVSVYVGPSLRLFDGILPDAGGPFVALGAEAGVRGFFTGRAPEGGWVMARGVLARMALRDGSRAEAGGYGSVLVGGTAVVGPGLVLSGGLGGSWFAYDIDGYGVSGPAPAAHTAVGWAF
ncbi:MAG: hypothetical protein ABMA64_11395 [Myxococcota bacterium]